MLRNLRAEMARCNVKPADIADHLGVRYGTVIDKLNGHYDFSVNDALKIKKKFFPDLKIDYLFENDELKAI